MDEKSYKKRLYKKIRISLLFGRNVLDVGCGNGEDAYYLSKNSNKVEAFDIEKSKNWTKYKNSNLSFKIADAQNIPYKNHEFDGVFLKDVLHHVNEPLKVLSEIDRVTKKGSIIILVEGNRYNPIFYIHMTKLLGHEHLSENKFKKLISKKFKNVEFVKFESHFIPFGNKYISALIAKSIEIFFENIPVVNKFQSYNLAIIRK